MFLNPKFPERDVLNLWNPVQGDKDLSFVNEFFSKVDGPRYLLKGGRAMILAPNVAAINNCKINMEHNHGGLVQILILSRLVMAVGSSR